MNKRKRVAIQKHRQTMKKIKDKRKPPPPTPARTGAHR